MKRDVCVLQILVLLIPHVRTGEHPPAPSSVRVSSEAHGGGIYLKCSFETRPGSFLGFVVVWLRLSALGLREELRQETTVHTSVHIELDGFNLRLGDKIYCSSSSFFLDSPEVRSPAVDSAEFFAGLRMTVSESSVLEEGGVYQLLLESTVPLPCVKDSDRCSLLLQLNTISQEEEQLGADVSLSSCAVELTSDPCADGPCSRTSLHVSPITDFILDGNRSTIISVKAIVTENVVWSGYSPEPLQIQVQDVQSAYCYSFTDPHTVTFDGRCYENSQIGTFVLFQSAACGVEVQVRLWECGGVEHAASCVCGFVVRDGGDVVSFDMCEGELGETFPQLNVKHRGPRSKLRITESYQGRKLTMTLSSGAFVRADVSSWGMSLTIRASGADRGHTQGLCGTYDEDPHNDFHSADGTEPLDLHSFVSAWRLPPGSSLFDSVPSSLSETIPLQFCLCSHTAAVSLSPDLPCPQPSPHPGSIPPSSLIPSLDVTQEYLTPAELLQTQTQDNRYD
ncbi:unnamed protein product [Knipowitschia caucasica]|uniref:VWFD domain-containing protein n=1 Tax=Knipowitschia caucasica TaxID=637954 RepID=A0AAV2MGP5_KNICA